MHKGRILRTVIFCGINRCVNLVGLSLTNLWTLLSLYVVRQSLYVYIAIQTIKLYFIPVISTAFAPTTSSFKLSRQRHFDAGLFVWDYTPFERHSICFVCRCVPSALIGGTSPCVIKCRIHSRSNKVCKIRAT